MVSARSPNEIEGGDKIFNVDIAPVLDLYKYQGYI
jgi:hypothetical protein